MNLASGFFGMNYGQVFAGLTRMDLEGRTEAKITDGRLDTRLSELFGKAVKMIKERPQDWATRYVGLLQMAGTVKKLYERYHYESALFPYGKMKEVFSEREIELVYGF